MDYEFEMVNDEDRDGAAEPLSGGDGSGVGVGGRRKRRGGELYDAFADGGSDEEIFTDDDEEEQAYRDEVPGEKDDARNKGKLPGRGPPLSEKST